jgi:hypothetical protein
VFNTNDFTPGIEAIFEENSSYYLIGYHPSNAQPDGTVRRIEVKVDHPDVEFVRTRTSYEAPSPEDVARQARIPPLSRAIADPIHNAELPLRVAATPFAIPGRRQTAAVAVVLGVRQAVPEEAASRRVTVMTGLHVIAVNTEGKIVGEDRSDARVTLRAGAQGDAEYEALSRLELPPGRYRLRIAAHHEASSRIGTVMTDVVVPDFNKSAASISGVALSVIPGRPSAPRALFRDILAFTPTAQRTFGSGESALACFFLYQDGLQAVAPATVTVKIVDSANQLVHSENLEIEATRFLAAEARARTPVAAPGGLRSTSSRTPTLVSSALRAAEVRYQIPLERLKPGTFLLAIESGLGGDKLQRHVVFSVK